MIDRFEVEIETEYMHLKIILSLKCFEYKSILKNYIFDAEKISFWIGT